MHSINQINEVKQEIEEKWRAPVDSPSNMHQIDLTDNKEDCGEENRRNVCPESYTENRFPPSPPTPIIGI